MLQFQCLRHTKKTDQYQKEVCDMNEIIEWNDVLCHQMKTHIDEL